MAYTTTLSDSRSWLSDPLTPGGTTIRCGTRITAPLTETQDGELVVYAGFRTELASYDSVSGSIGVAFVGVTAAQVAQLRAWKGRTLLLRRTDGQRFYGGYLSLSAPAFLLAGPPPLYDVEVTFQVVTFSDTV